MAPAQKINPLYVDKKRVLVHIQLINGVAIKGFLHLAHRVRLTDTLNFQTGDKPFLAVTDAQFITPDGESKAISFVVINRQQIVTCIPRQGVSE